jgi:general secretion pathway protein J
VRRCRESAGFTLVEVLIALSITAFVATIAYTSLSSALVGVERTRATADRTHEVSRAWMIISRDLRQFSARPVRDEFGEEEPAMTGGPLARHLLSLTRAGWHNPNALSRSNLQRVNYRLEEQALWRESYPVLDRAGDTPAQEVKLLEGVEQFTLGFLGSLAAVETAGDGTALDTRDWAENWVPDFGDASAPLAPPVAVEVRLQLVDWGEMRRIYELPPL